MEEKWKPIPVLELRDKYSISNYANLKSTKTGKILEGKSLRSGYLSNNFNISGKSKGYKRHRLVALAFIENKDPKKNLCKSYRW
jgi:hypothetical protein